jgi:hypothetical protein
MSLEGLRKTTKRHSHGSCITHLRQIINLLVYFFLCMLHVSLHEALCIRPVAQIRVLSCCMRVYLSVVDPSNGTSLHEQMFLCLQLVKLN